MRFPLRSSAPVLLGVALCAWPASGRADDDARAMEPAAPHALGRVLVAGPAPTGPTLLASAGYGYTESVLGMGDVHHRIAGALALDERPLRWLDFTLRLDGRYDAHVIPGQATDSGMVGDPRLYARVDQAWAGGLRLGARAGLWLPGRDAPSLDWGAISPEIVGMASYVPASAPVALTVNAGYRLDRSAHSAPDAALLSPSDRLALEVSAFNEVLVGVAATLGRGPAQGFLEASADLLVGAGAPAPKASPIFLGGGARFAPARNLRLEAEVEVSPSSRPDVSPSAPLVPIPPRVAAWLGLTYRFGAEPVPPTPPDLPPAQPPARPAPVAAPPPPPLTVELVGHVSASDAGKLLELRVEITSGGGPREVTLDDDGHFRADGKPGEALTVSAEAKGYSPAQATATLAAETPNHLELTLERRPPRGQIRGLVRSLRGAVIGADIVVEPEPAGSPGAATPETQRLRAESGRFEIDVAPGRYRVTIAAPGYETQKRKVEVEEDGVTVLNVDLRTER
jgi:hypothetical protein